ncbi:DNA starvation/stationary phase protection protein Dps [Niveispirillum sp. SYP-B3756]|uniref:DNA starvation/stationary phase protection protein Dps n=1 Tax=Niveispirillum sp. SYP-B3756 TaxID=2662178 RepID=UPI001290A9B0|nr:DNA starvation/stationary phase protection protein Dps [Niveispirillum sp. SYP-B3756]MQP67905.1 DNA starvation/stationary phase protection protein Dps [Niveispirillum sp. SYP-B3756]
MHQTNNTLSEAVRVRSVELLNRHLAAAIDLHAQVKQAHWNVRGPAFNVGHRLFDSTSVKIEVYTDLIAERAGALGGTAQGKVQAAVEQSFLAPYPLGLSDVRHHVIALSRAITAFGRSAREAVDLSISHGDPDTANLFTEISRNMGRQLWLVEAHAMPS